MMVVCLDTPVLVSVPSASGSGCASHGVLVASAFAHGHEWIQDEGLIGLFHCADPTCEGHAVCPGCLHSLDVALHALGCGSGGLLVCVAL